MNACCHFRFIWAIIGITFLAYLNAFKGVFQFDDYNVIVNYSPVHSLQDCLTDMRHGIRPLLKLSYALNWVSGFGLFGFHFFNISIHALNGVLVFYLVKFFKAEKTSNIASFFCALLFSLHPIQTEAVTYICGRSMSLMTFFYLASVLSYLNGQQKKSFSLQFIISPILFLFAVATKEIAVTLPFALLIWESCQQKQKMTSMLKKQLVHWFLLGAIFIAILFKPNYQHFLTFAFSERSIYQNLLTQINAVTYLLSRLFWIGHLNLDPDLPVISELDVLTAFQFCVLAGLFLYATTASTLKIWWRFGALWFVLHLLPTNSIIPRLDVVNERQMYLAILGLFLPLSLDINRFYQTNLKAQFIIKSGLFFVLSLFFTFTILRNTDYYSEVALWENVTQKSPYKARGFNNLGVAYELEGNVQQAVLAYEKAVELDKNYDVAKNNLHRMKVEN